MPDDIELRRTLSEPAARQLANATKTRAQMLAITPRWLISFLPWVPAVSYTHLASQYQRSGIGRHALDVWDFYRQSKFERSDADWRPICHQLYQPVFARCLRRSWQSGDPEYRFFENGGQHMAS